MISQGDVSLDALRYLIGCRAECEWLDYKQELHLASDAAACAFTRDVLAMKNVGGGYVVVGVQDKTWKPKGLSAPLPFDSKLLRDVVRRCCGLELDVDIVHHTAFAEKGTGRLAANVKSVACLVWWRKIFFRKRTLGFEGATSTFVEETRLFELEVAKSWSRCLSA
jgi:hypothetical protein